MLRYVSLLIIGVLSFGAHVGAQQEIPPAGEISMKGERVCLPAIPDESGLVRLDCAIGLRGDDDNFYGLRLADLSKSQPFPVMYERVLVRGHFTPGSDGAYEIVGDIVYTSIEPIDDPKVIVGKLLCLEGGESDAVLSPQCRAAVETDRGRFWGLQMSTSSVPALTPGTRVKAEGTPMRELPEDWHPWVSRGAARRIEGVLEVARIEASRSREEGAPP